MSIFFNSCVGYSEDGNGYELAYIEIPILEALRDISSNWEDYYCYDDEKQASLNALVEDCKTVQHQTQAMIELRPEFKDKYLADSERINAALEKRARKLLRKDDVIIK